MFAASELQKDDFREVYLLLRPEGKETKPGSMLQWISSMVSRLESRKVTEHAEAQPSRIQIEAAGASKSFKIVENHSNSQVLRPSDFGPILEGLRNLWSGLEVKKGPPRWFCRLGRPWSLVSQVTRSLRNNVYKHKLMILNDPKWPKCFTIWRCRV